MTLRERLDGFLHRARVLRAEHSAVHDVTQLHVLQLGGLEPLQLMVDVLVNLRFVDEVGIELLKVPLTGDEHEDRERALAGIVVDDQAQVVDLLDELLT